MKRNFFSSMGNMVIMVIIKVIIVIIMVILVINMVILVITIVIMVIIMVSMVIIKIIGVIIRVILVVMLIIMIKTCLSSSKSLWLMVIIMHVMVIKYGTTWLERQGGFPGSTQPLLNHRMRYVSTKMGVCPGHTCNKIFFG